MRGCARALTSSALLIGVAAVLVLSPPHAYGGRGSGGNASGAEEDFTAGGRELPDLNEHATLSDYLAYAALNNPGLEAAFHRWKAALEKAPQVRSMPDPAFTYAHFIREVETRVGPQKRKLRLSQKFPWFGKLQGRESVALEAANAEEQRYEQEKLRLYHRVRSAYFEYYYLGRSIAVTEENVNLLRQVESVARTRYETGTAGYGDLLKAQVELSRLEDRLLAQRELRSPMSARLSVALGRPSEDLLPWPSDIPEDLVASSDEELAEKALERNPELKRFDFLAAKEKAAADLAGKDYFPDFTLGIERIDTDEALNPGVVDSGKDPLVATLTVNLPIWYGRTGGARREAEFRRRAALEQRTERENTIAADLRLALYHFRDAERKIALYRDDLVPRARQALEVERRAFEAGSAGYLDLLDAQRTLLEFELSVERAMADRGQRFAELEMLVGGEI